MEEGGPGGSAKPETDRDAELALSLHRNLNWAGRERSSRHQQPGPGPKEEALRRVRDEAHDRKRRRDAISPRGTDDGGQHKKHMSGGFGGQAVPQGLVGGVFAAGRGGCGVALCLNGRFERASCRQPCAAPRSPTHPAFPALPTTDALPLVRTGSEAGPAAQWALPRSALTAAVREVRAKAARPRTAGEGWGLVKCFVAGSTWAWLLPAAALSSPAALLEALEAKAGGAGDELRSLTLIGRRGAVARFDAGPGAGEPSARWTTAAEDVARVYVGPAAV